MSKIADKIMSMTAESMLDAAVVSAGFASHGGTYQPEEPEMLREYAEKLSENK